MQLALMSDGGRNVLQAVQENPACVRRLAWTESSSPPLSSSSSLLTASRAASRVKISPETEAAQRRAGSSSGEVEKLKPQPAGPSQQNSSIDLITGQYLCGQWPREVHQAQRTCMTDKSTQTPGIWTDDLEGLQIHKRSSSWSSADHRGEIAKLRVQLRRSVLGIHHNKEQESVSCFSHIQTKLPPVLSKPAVCRVSSYNDSINRELESVFVGDTWGRQQERELQDGRCAPVPPHQNSEHLTQNTDTQLINGQHSPHVFPSAADLPAALEPFISRTDCAEGLDSVNDRSSPLPPLASSPKPNNSFIFKRVPPEGCEKIKVFEETFPCRSKGFPVFSCPDRNKVSFIPTSSGPFCPVRQLDSTLFPTDPHSGQSVGQFKQDRPPPHFCSPHRTLHC